ncbi:hypothetical protein GMES_0446 [Paraglaciecola mesophila KMM 241]|uniref:Uncharacterized protein n=1 Tax=Paraglaciecola mesophila KMM 241 TaxID=1128912 RepID=K6YX34_9ALTE|nr:hypothetical protein GMES_0446 [Paraglaciecola mesophila KMM 241]
MTLLSLGDAGLTHIKYPPPGNFYIPRELFSATYQKIIL